LVFATIAVVISIASMVRFVPFMMMSFPGHRWHREERGAQRSDDSSGNFAHKQISCE